MPGPGTVKVQTNFFYFSPTRNILSMSFLVIHTMTKDAIDFDLPSFIRLPEPETELPDFLSNGFGLDPLEEISKEGPIDPIAAKAKLKEVENEACYQSFLDFICEGFSTEEALIECGKLEDRGLFLKWIHAREERKERFRSAKVIRTEIWASRLLKYSLEDSMEDVARSRLKVDTLKWLLTKENRETYGDVKQVDINGNVSILAAIEEANNRVRELRDIEVVDMIGEEDHG